MTLKLTGNISDPAKMLASMVTDAPGSHAMPMTAARSERASPSNGMYRVGLAAAKYWLEIVSNCAYALAQDGYAFTSHEILSAAVEVGEHYARLVEQKEKEDRDGKV